MSIEVVGIRTYPVKSCGALEHESLPLTPAGLPHDRKFMLVDEEGDFISQRREPKLALVKPQIAPNRAASLVLEAPGMEQIGVELLSRPKGRTSVRARLHGQVVDGLDGPKEASQWFSEYLDKEVWFISDDPKNPRKVDPHYRQDGVSERVDFADGFSLLLTSMVSLRDFSEKLGFDVDMDRFRPNIIVDSDELEPYQEDTWRRVRIGQQVARVVKPCKRCVTINVNQTTGEKDERILKALARIRRGVDLTMPSNAKDRNGAFFGQNLQHLYGISPSGRPKRINIGGKIRVTTNSTPNVQITS